MIGGKGQGARGKGHRGNGATGKGDTPQLELLAAGTIARARRGIGDARDSTVKFKARCPGTRTSSGRCAPTSTASAKALAPRLGVRQIQGPCRALVSGLSFHAAVRCGADDHRLRRGCAGPRVGTDALRSGLLAGLLAATVLLTVALCIRWWSLWLLVWLAGSASWRACLADELPPSGVGPSRAGRRSPWLAPYWCSPPACWPGAGAAWATCRRRCPPAGWAEAARAALGQAPAACGSVHGGTLPPR